MIGYACTNLTLKKECNLFPVEGISYQELLKIVDHKQFLRDLAAKNIENTLKILEWNIKNDIYMYRLSPYMFPYATHEYFNWPLVSIKPFLERIGQFVNKHKIRLSVHLPQYINIGSSNDKLNHKFIDEILLFSNAFEFMNASLNCNIVIHGPSIEINKMITINNAIKTIKNLDDRTKQRLVLENDERIWTISDLYRIYESIGTSIVFDYFHHLINHEQERSYIDDLSLALSTWTTKPKIHYSEQAMDKPIGAHSYLIKKLLISPDFDTMVESKGKELSILPFIPYQKTKETMFITLNP